MVDPKKNKKWSLEESFDNFDTWAHFKTDSPNIVQVVLGSLRRRKVLIASCGLLILMIGLLLGLLRQPVYTASAQLLVFTKELQPGSDALLTLGRTDTALVQNQVEILQSRSVLLKAIDNLSLKDTGDFGPIPVGLAKTVRQWFLGEPENATEVDQKGVVTSQVLESLRRHLSVSRSGMSHTVLVSFKDPDPNKAARVVNEIVQVYLRDRGGTLEGDPADNPWLRERLTGLGPNARVISDAEVPIRPDGPRLLVLIAGSLVFGLLFGCGLAVLLDLFDGRLRTADQAEAICDTECLGIIPEYRGNTGKPGPETEWSPGASQAYRRIRASILSRKGATILGVTSPSLGEGTTTVASQLAHFLARNGSKVLLVDAAFQNATLSRMYAPGPRLGLSDLVVDKILLEQSVVATSEDNLYFLPVGQSAARGKDLNWNAHIDKMLHAARPSYDAIIVDLPSLSSGAEIRVAARSIDSILLVVHWGVTEVSTIKSGLQLLGNARAKLGGVLLNRVSAAQMRAYGDRRFSTATGAREPGLLSYARSMGRSTIGRKIERSVERSDNSAAKR